MPVACRNTIDFRSNEWLTTLHWTDSKLSEVCWINLKLAHFDFRYSNFFTAVSTYTFLSKTNNPLLKRTHCRARMYVNYLHRNKMDKERPKIRCRKWKEMTKNCQMYLSSIFFFFGKSCFKEENKHRKNMKSEMGTTNCMPPKRPMTITHSSSFIFFFRLEKLWNGHLIFFMIFFSKEFLAL